MSNSAAAEIDLLIETDERILEQVRKDLNQEYVRLMSRALQAGRQPGQATPQAMPNSGEQSI
jgi:hypothetical protein